MCCGAQSLPSPTSSSHPTEDVTFQHLCKRCRMVLKATFFEFNKLFFESTSYTASPRRNIAFPQANSYLTAGQAHQIEVDVCGAFSLNGVIKRGCGYITSWKFNIDPQKMNDDSKKDVPFSSREFWYPCWFTCLYFPAFYGNPEIFTNDHKCARLAGWQRLLLFQDLCLQARKWSLFSWQKFVERKALFITWTSLEGGTQKIELSNA